MVCTPGPIVSFVTVVLLCACSEAGPGSPEESFTLRTGESKRSETAGLTVRFDKVVSDSRCPKGVNCIRAGEAVVRFAVGTEAGQNEPLDFKVPPGGSDSARFGDVLITIVELNPQTESGKRIDPSDYEARVRLSQE